MKQKPPSRTQRKRSSTKSVTALGGEALQVEEARPRLERRRNSGAA